MIILLVIDELVLYKELTVIFVESKLVIVEFVIFALFNDPIVILFTLRFVNVELVAIRFVSVELEHIKLLTVNPEILPNEVKKDPIVKLLIRLLVIVSLVLCKELTVIFVETKLVIVEFV